MNTPHVRIDSPDGIPWRSSVTVDGVQIPCTKATWTADAASGEAASVMLEVPNVGLTAEVREVVARYVTPVSIAPWFFWKCPCGMEMAHETPELSAAAFANVANHVAGCEHAPAAQASAPAVPDGQQ